MKEEVKRVQDLEEESSCDDDEGRKGRRPTNRSELSTRFGKLDNQG